MMYGDPAYKKYWAQPTGQEKNPWKIVFDNPVYQQVGKAANKALESNNVTGVFRGYQGQPEWNQGVKPTETVTNPYGTKTPYIREMYPRKGMTLLGWWKEAYNRNMLGKNHFQYGWSLFAGFSTIAFAV